MLLSKIDPLKYLLNRATLTRCMEKWVMILSEFDIEYVDKKAIKGQVIADQLSKAPIEDNHPMLIDFPNEDIFNMDIANELKLYFDGLYTRNGLGAGIIFIIAQGDVIPQSYWIAVNYTNNIAEYEVLITKLMLAVQWNIQHLKVYGDSQLIM